MECVWKLTTNWASCATAQRDTVDLIVKIWIHVARIHVLTPELVYILMMDLFVIAQWGLRERTVKSVIFANLTLVNLAINAIKPVLTAISV